MPLNISLDINGQVLNEYRISRLEKLKGGDAWHNYLITDGYGNQAEFNHQYSQGAEECLRRGLEALAKKRGAI